MEGCKGQMSGSKGERKDEKTWGGKKEKKEQGKKQTKVEHMRKTEKRQERKEGHEGGKNCSPKKEGREVVEEKATERKEERTINSRNEAKKSEHNL